MIRGLYKTDVVTITPEKSIKEAATLMRDRNVGDVVVIQTNQANGKRGRKAQVAPVGILTDRDLVTTCLTGDSSKIDEIKVGDVMSKNVVFIKEDVGLFEAIRTMRKAGVGRILVVDANKSLLGSLTSTTIFDLLNEELHELGMIARSRRSQVARTGDFGLPPKTPEPDVHH